MELEIINKYDENEQHVKYVNSLIHDRVCNLISKYYNIIPVIDNKTHGYLIYKKLNFKFKYYPDICNSILFKFIHFIWPDQGIVIVFYVDGNVVKVYANSPNEVKLYQLWLDSNFNNMDNVKIKIVKYYCDWEF